MGFAATPDGMLYVFGGNDGGTEGGGVGLMGVVLFLLLLSLNIHRFIQMI
jgi:hypothetical protein